MPKKILVVDDSKLSSKFISEVLLNEGYEIINAYSGMDGLRLVREEKPDLVLLDIVMQDISGFEVCRILRESESNNLMPIIMLTSQDAQEDKLVGLELGADDYIVKPFNNREMICRVRNTLRRIDRNRAASPLTGLSGNLEIQAEITSRIEKREQFAVIYIDLDNFKAFNDVYGFAKGDIAIKMTADIMRDATKDEGTSDDFLGHIGGDDFIIICDLQHVEGICTEIVANFDFRIRTLYNLKDIEAGFIRTLNRRGEHREYPIMTISLAVVTNELRELHNHLEVSEIAAELKKKAKALPGSNYLKDKRKQ